MRVADLFAENRHTPSESEKNNPNFPQKLIYSPW